ncbi:MAG: hypothetical protein ACP5HS_09530 [Anaerolineae bacterium]
MQTQDSNPTTPSLGATMKSDNGDIQRTIDALTDALLHRMGDEVDLIFQYGSHITGMTHRYSDVDLSWIPVHEETWDSITVMVDETLFDLYAMH